MTTAIITASALAALLWPVVVANNIYLNDSDAWGNGLTAWVTIFLTIGLWCLLSLAFLLASLQGGIPHWSSLAAILLLPLTCAAALIVTKLLSDHEPVQWMLAIQLLAPPLVLAYIASVRLHPNLSSGVLWSAALILAALPLPTLATLPARRKQREADSKRKHDELMARLNALTPQSTVREHLPFIDPSLGLYDETVRKIQALGHKQSDIEQMFKEGNYEAFPWMWNFGLDATPVICEGSRHYLRSQAKELQRSPRHPHYRDIEIAINSLESTLRWLAQNDCPMTKELDAIEAAVNSYPKAGSEGALFLAAIREIRSNSRSGDYTL